MKFINLQEENQSMNEGKPRDGSEVIAVKPRNASSAPGTHMVGENCRPLHASSKLSLREETSTVQVFTAATILAEEKLSSQEGDNMQRLHLYSSRILKAVSWRPAWSTEWVLGWPMVNRKTPAWKKINHHHHHNKQNKTKKKGANHSWNVKMCNIYSCLGKYISTQCQKWSRETNSSICKTFPVAIEVTVVMR